MLHRGLIIVACVALAACSDDSSSNDSGPGGPDGAPVDGLVTSEAGGDSAPGADGAQDAASDATVVEGGDTCPQAPTVLWSGTTVVIHGDTTGASNAVNLGQNSCTGDVNAGGDLFYSFDLPAGSYSITLTPGGGADLALYLLDSCTAPSCDNGSDNMGANAAEQLGLSLASAATVLVVVDSWDASEAGPFTLEVAAAGVAADGGALDGAPDAGPADGGPDAVPADATPASDAPAGDAPAGDAPPASDAGAMDGAAVDGAAVDGAADDGPTADGLPSADLALTDGSTADGGPADLALTDGSTVDAGPTSDSSAVDAAAADSAAPGTLVITEIMANPAAVTDANGEWFEIYNAGSTTVNLKNWTIADKGSDSHTISADVMVAPGQYVVLGNKLDSGVNGGVTVAYSYGGGWYLSNGDDEILLYDPQNNLVDEVSYDDAGAWTVAAGSSMSLKAISLDNNSAANWCLESAPWGPSTDNGTPGAIAGCN